MILFQFHKESGGAESISTDDSRNPWAGDDERQMSGFPAGSAGHASSQSAAMSQTSIFKQKPISASQGKRDPGGSQILLMLLRLEFYYFEHVLFKRKELGVLKCNRISSQVCLFIINAVQV